MPQGAGKSHVMRLLGEYGLFPMEDFVQVDPDSLRRELPEMQAYLRRDPGTAGSLTHKEVRNDTSIFFQVLLSLMLSLGWGRIEVPRCLYL